MALSLRIKQSSKQGALLVVRVKIIAEAGVNHNGSIDLAKRLIDVAKSAGVDVVKFQTFKTEKLVTKNALKADYQNRNTNTSGPQAQFDMLKKLELSEEQFIELKKYCDQVGIEFLSTAFDLDSLVFLEKMGIKTWKIPSGEITNLPYLEWIGRLNQKVILSTGMCFLSEVEDAISCLMNAGMEKKNITLLHCTTEYPAPYDQVNLKAINLLKNKFDIEVGYSDHTEGVEVAIAAVALGAQVIEKHFTLDQTLPGPDHKASLDPQNLSLLVRSIRNIENALGEEVKKPTQLEVKNIKIVRKSIVAKHAIRKGEIFSEKNLTVKRPGTGISPMKWHSIIGQRATRDYFEDELI